MDRIINDERQYRSPLRDQQAVETRARILDALVRVMARGIADLSIPAVAREAVVSIPTVYRHFGSKAGLLRELQPHFAARMGIDRLPAPTSLDDLDGVLRDAFARIEALDELAQAALLSPLAEQARAAQMPARQRSFRAIADMAAPQLPERSRARLGRLLLVLTMTSSLRTLRVHLGLTGDEAAADVAWIIRAAVAGAASVDPS